MARKPKVATSAKKDEVLEFIRKFIADNEYPPSYREIADGVGLASTACVHRYIHQLVDEGAIAIAPNRNRTITITSK